jgi:hypothetical protein
MLKRRLARRGVGLTLGTLLAVCASRAAAAPGPLVAAAARAGTQAAAAGSLAGAEVSAGAASMAAGALRRFALARLKLAGALLLATLLLAFTDGLTQQTKAAPAAPPGVKAPAPVPCLPYYEPQPAPPGGATAPGPLAARPYLPPGRRA